MHSRMRGYANEPRLIIFNSVAILLAFIFNLHIFWWQSVLRVQIHRTWYVQKNVLNMELLVLPGKTCSILFLFWLKKQDWKPFYSLRCTRLINRQFCFWLSLLLYQNDSLWKALAFLGACLSAALKVANLAICCSRQQTALFTSRALANWRMNTELGQKN